jgi:molecular chaperone HscB
MDAFDVLGLTPSFDLDPQLIERRYRDLQRALHPDRFVKAPASERRASLARAVSVNDAYRTLRDALKRAELLLARAGADVGERAGPPADPALLMEVMELREALSETKASGDLNARARLVETVNARSDEATAALRTALGSLTGGDAEAHADAARALSRLRYYRRFLDEVGVLEDALD